MRYLAIATDYDGTLAHDGVVSEETVEALERFIASGRRMIMVTGRELDDLIRVCPRLDLFDWVVVENGLLLYRPQTREEIPLGPPPPPEFLAALTGAGIPFSVGRSIVATWTPHETAVLEIIRTLGIEWQLIFNKGAVMILPSGMNKRTGLAAALERMGLSAHNVAGIGDAENDHAFLNVCEAGVAVSNALPTLKQQADMVATASHGDGVIELVNQILADDLAVADGAIRLRHSVLLGKTGRGQESRVPGYGPCILVAGPSGSGKSTAASGVIERLAEQGYQFCCIDPEGDYQGFAGAVQTGDEHTEPVVDRVLEVLQTPANNAVVNMLSVPLQDRPQYFAGLLPRLLETRAATGRPHWLLVDEAHHMLPSAWRPAPGVVPQDLHSTVLITLEPGHVSKAVLDRVDIVVAIGNPAKATIRDFCEATCEAMPKVPSRALKAGQAIVWERTSGCPPRMVNVEPATADRQRHRRKYAEGDLGEESFYFRGPEERLNLKSQNLHVFVQTAEGVDDDTWAFHLERGDYTNWFRDCVKDPELALAADAIRKEKGLDAAESRARIIELIEDRFTLSV